MFSLVRIAPFSVVARSSSTLMATRHFSDCAPAQKLRGIFEEYRKQHYSRETPHRFRKELVKAAEEKNNPSMIKVDNLNRVLENIGHADDRLSEDELNDLLAAADADVNEGDRLISFEKMLKLM
mmetsp:Transcript_3654/g.5268  ORF Transcript_3654/g.5268 Transcript_3654/m.5268 type:complete len:124 (-) Transcript_3654:1855-2226(-)